MKQPTQNEPQLSAEIIRDIENHNPDGSRAWTIRQEQVNKNVQHFLATALEEQRAKYVEQVKTMPCTYREDNLYRQDVIDLLNRKE